MIYEDYSIFTPGPVKMSQKILDIGAKQTPYFRNRAFSEVLLECESMLLELVNAPKESRVIFLTASGTAGMESVVYNLLSSKDKALVINGGGFGQRFVDLCNSYKIDHINFKVANSNLEDIEYLIPSPEANTLIVNAHETSVGLLYDLDALGEFVKKNNIFFIVDAISMLITDPLDMEAQNIDVLIASSQKGLALPPGLSMVILSPRAIERLNSVDSLYFNFKNYLKDGLRGQTPYTPAVTIILQLQARLKQIIRDGGIKSSISRAKEVATHFRREIKRLPLAFYSNYMPNAMTTLTPTDSKSAFDIVRELEERYRVVVCPNGGSLKDKIFRVSHMGDMDIAYIDVLIDAMYDYYGLKRL